MIQHFRKKFILISTSALLVVIITIIGSISAVTYFQAQQEVNSVLSILSDNQGRMPARQVPSQSNFFPSSALHGKAFPSIATLVPQFRTTATRFRSITSTSYRCRRLRFGNWRSV